MGESLPDKQELQDRLIEILHRISGADPETIQPESRLMEDIGIDSLGFYEILIEADTMAKRPQMGAIYKEYVDRCFKAGAMDFDDLLLKTNELLTRFPDVLAKYQDRFRYILVDEYQDTNHSQYLIVRALSDRLQNICVVGA